MNQELKRKVLSVFKQLHRTRLTVFEGDTNTLAAARAKINEEFLKNQSVRDAAKIEELVKYGHDVEGELRRSVIQAVKKDDGSFSAKLRPEVTRIDSKPYTPMPDHLIGPFKRKKTKCKE